MKSTTAFCYIRIVLYLFLLQLAAGSEEAPFPDPEMMQYLDKLFQDAKKVNRFANGELNLLPVKSSGFANTIRCFSDIISGSSVFDNSRNLQFNLSALSITDKIVSIHLVLKQVNNSSSTYKIQLHEITGNGSEIDLKLLDTGEYSGEWYTLYIQNVVDSIDASSKRRNYQLVLSLSRDEGPISTDLLKKIKPMLLVYINDISIPESTTNQERGEVSSGDKNIQMRTGQRTRREAPSEPTLEELKQLHCRKHVRTLSFKELGWPGEEHDVISPSVATFSFCGGICNNPYYPDFREQYNNHAIFTTLARPDLAEAGIAPCCVPDETNVIGVQYVRHKLISETTYSNVQSCRCL